MLINTPKRQKPSRAIKLSEIKYMMKYQKLASLTSIYLFSPIQTQSQFSISSIVSMSPIIKMFPLKSMSTSLYPMSIFSTSSLLLLAAIKGKLIELVGWAPINLFFSNKIFNLCCFFFNRCNWIIFSLRICYLIATWLYIFWRYCSKNCLLLFCCLRL